MKRIALIFSVVTILLTPISYADDSIKNACPNGVKPNKSLIKTTILHNSKEKGPYGPEESISYVNNIVNKEGECFKVNAAKFSYLIDKNNAVYKVYIDSDKLYIEPQLLVFQYGALTVKHRRVSGVIKATGKYANYKDREGIPRKMPQFLIIKESSY